MGPYARKRKSMKSIDHRGKPWYLLQSSSDTTKSVLCLTWNNAASYHSTHGEHTTNSLKRKRNVCFNKCLEVQLITYNFCPVRKCNFCLLVFVLCLAGALPFCDLDNPGFPKYKVAVGVGEGGGGIFLYDSDGVLSFDSLRGVNCIFSLAWVGGDEELCFP